ncbi:hypothetical protein [Microlunatus endophyticus]|uniref:hypothetical protein n=1 Tax=Microlunatus endophyticus TaxID=1716077 RepID=UPI0016652FE2|nr:hypothetical protein [Microlunatus endophyticus]
MAAKAPDSVAMVPILPLDQLPSLIDASAVLARVEATIGAEQRLWPVAFWPTQPGRDRLYLHLLTDSGKSRGFLKIARDADACGLKHEARALQERHGGSGLLRTPKVLASGGDPAENTSWLLVEPLPSDARPARQAPDQLLTEISGPVRHVSTEELDQLSWWQTLGERLSDAPLELRRAVDRLIPYGVDVASIHGDLRPHNMVASRTRIWVYDWEESALDGPAGTDAFSLRVLGGSLRDLVRRIRSLTTDERNAFVWSCAFGWARASLPWRSATHAWNESGGWKQ